MGELYPYIYINESTVALMSGFVKAIHVTNYSQLLQRINPLNAELNPICHLLALLECATIVDVSGLRVKNAIYTYGIIQESWTQIKELGTAEHSISSVSHTPGKLTKWRQKSATAPSVTTETLAVAAIYFTTSLHKFHLTHSEHNSKCFIRIRYAFLY